MQNEEECVIDEERDETKSEHRADEREEDQVEVGGATRLPSRRADRILATRTSR